MLGAAAGAALAVQLRGPVPGLIFALQSLYYGWGLLRSTPAAPGSWRERLSTACCKPGPAVAGPGIAAFCACAGMGGGSLLVPYLLRHAVALRHATATSSALNLCIAVAGVSAFVVWGGAGSGNASVSWLVAGLVGCSAVLAVPSGVALAHRLPITLFRKLLGAVTLLGAGVLIVRSVG